MINKDWGESQFLQDPVTAGVAVGGSLLTGYMQADAAKDAAKSQAKAAGKASDVQLQMFREGQEATAPWRSAGGEALSLLGGIYGFDPYQQQRQDRDAQLNELRAQYDKVLNQEPLGGPVGKAFGSTKNARLESIQKQIEQLEGRYIPEARTREDVLSQFETSPGYQFQLQEAQRASDRAAAARGGYDSGAQMRRLQEIAQGTASMQFGNYVSGLQSLAGIGQTTATQGAQLGQQVAGQVGQNYIAAGQATAQGQIQQANIYGNLLGQGAQLYGLAQGGYFGGSPQSAAGPYGMFTTGGTAIA